MGLAVTLEYLVSQFKAQDADCREPMAVSSSQALTCELL